MPSMGVWGTLGNFLGYPPERPGVGKGARRGVTQAPMRKRRKRRR